MEYRIYRKVIRGNFRCKKKLINGITVAAINSENKNESERVYSFAIEESQNFYKEITGKTLSVEYVNDIGSLSDEKIYFVLGKELAASDGFTADELSSDTGYIVKKGEKGIYLYGKTGYGTLNAVYAFLNQAFGLEIYTDTVYSYNRTEFDYATISDEVFNPSIDNQWAIDGALTVAPEGASVFSFAYQRRLGFVNSWQVFNGSFHSFLQIVPYEKYGSDHPDWYTETTATDSGEKFVTLCLAEGGTEMAKAVADYVYKEIVSQDSDGNVKDCFIFGPPDKRGWSNSSAAAELKNKYGAYSAEYILFMNEVARIFNDNYNVGRKIKLIMMAYNAVLEAPAYSSELAFYNSDKISLNVMYAPIEASSYRAITDSTEGKQYGKSNSYFLTQYQNWQQFGGEVYYWHYSAQFDNYFVPLDTISNMQETYRKIAEYDVNYFVDQGVSGVNSSTDFSALKIYLKSKLAKNVNADVETLIKNFCNAYYGAGGEKMYDLLAAERAWYKKLSDSATSDNGGKDPLGCHILANSGIFDQKNWDDTPTKTGALFWEKTTYDASMLKGWYEDYVLAALADVDENSEYAKRIKIEGLAIRYMAYAVYEDATYGTFEEIASDALSLGVTKFAEGNAYTKSGTYVSGDISNLG